MEYQLAKMPDERLPKRIALFGHIDGSGMRGRSQKQWVDYVKEDLQLVGFSFTWWRKSQDKAGLEGCHGMCATTHLISGLERV